MKKKYSLEFKKEVLLVALKSQSDYTQVSKDFGLPANTVSSFKWQLKTLGLFNDILKEAHKKEQTVLRFDSTPLSSMPKAKPVKSDFASALGIITYYKIDNTVFKQGGIAIFKKNQVRGPRTGNGEYPASIIKVNQDSIVVGYYEAASEKQLRQKITLEDLISQNPRFTLKPAVIKAIS